jgi:outer membrane biosynthesis protein TonB
MDSTTPPPVPPKPAKEPKKRIRKPADPSKTKAKKQKITVPQMQVAAKVPDNNDAVSMPKLGFELTYYELSGAQTTVMTTNLKDHVSKLYSTNAASVFQYDDDGTLTLFPLLEGNGAF